TRRSTGTSCGRSSCGTGRRTPATTGRCVSPRWAPDTCTGRASPPGVCRGAATVSPASSASTPVTTSGTPPWMTAGSLVTSGTPSPEATMSDVPEPTVRVTRYEVSCLPQDNINAHHFTITVEWRGDDRWAVLHHGFCLGADGEWDYEPRPSSRE